MLTPTKYQETDYAEVTRFLSNLYQSDRLHPYWLPARWEYATFLVAPLHKARGKASWVPSVTLWKDGETLAVITNSESPDENYYLHLAPAHRTAEKVDFLVEQLEKTDQTGKLTIWALAGDGCIEHVLEKRGYKKQDIREYLNWVELATYDPIHTELPSDIHIQPIEDRYLESHFVCAAAAFQSAPVPLDVYRTLQSAPSYNRNFDLIMVRNEQVIALCTIWVDRGNNIAYFEPVATHPEWQGKGLGKALMQDGLRRLKDIGVSIAYVGAYGDDRMSFYNKCGFTSRVAMSPWSRV